MGIGPCVATKVCAAFWKKERFVIGWAMVGRAEFAYLIAQLAASMNMMDQKVFSVVIWSLLYATVLAPFMFRKVLQKYKMARAETELKGEGGEFSAEERAQWEKEHGLDPDAEFRQSGHLPIIPPDGHGHGDAHGHGDEKAKLTAAVDGHDVHKGESTKGIVHSEVPNPSHPPQYHETHEKAVLSANVHHADHGHGSSNEHFPMKESAQENAGARGSGFLCCLFFRKIIIM
jgi:hypothetical protein